MYRDRTVVERKRYKEHPDVRKATDATSKATSKRQRLRFQIKASDVKEYVGDKNKNMTTNVN